MTARTRGLWRRLPRDVRSAAWLFPTVALIYTVIWPFLQFPGRR